MQDRSKGFILGSVIGGLGGLVVGSALAALFWNDLVSVARKLIARLFKRDEQVNFEILLQ